jgi:hypothetical protein
MLVEAAHLAVRYNPELRAIFEAERQKGHAIAPHWKSHADSCATYSPWTRQE